MTNPNSNQHGTQMTSEYYDKQVFPLIANIEDLVGSLQMFPLLIFKYQSNNVSERHQEEMNKRRPQKYYCIGKYQEKIM